MNPLNPFFEAFDWLKEAEAGFVNDPKDPGGPTGVMGVSLRAVKLRDKDKDGTLDFDLDKDGDVDVEDMKLVTEEHAQKLYREDYWSLSGAASGSHLSCDSLPYRWAIAVFDAAVLQGPRTAVALMQKTVGAKADGILGPKTVTLVRNGDHMRNLARFAQHRLDRMSQHPQADRYMKGWTYRVVLLHQKLFDGMSKGWKS